MIRQTITIAEKKDLPTVRMLAEKIWPHAYGNILPAGQVDYMLDLIYSPASLSRQVEDDHHIFLILGFNARPSGFASYSIDPAAKKAKLHKIYIDQALHGKGLGKLLLEDVAARVRSAACTILQLDVNRQNRARYFYEKQGFKIKAEKDTDIGNGYWMRDFIMEKELTNS
jgi:GNAT superfamily N-acetyltransferase